MPLAIIVLFSCNSNETKDTKATDSTAMTKTVDTGKAALTDTLSRPATAAAINIKDFEVPEKEALEMIKWMKGCKPSDRHDGSAMYENITLTDAIKKANPACAVTWVDARFRDKDDEGLYCRMTGIDSTGGRCAVKNYKTMLMRVTCAKGDPYYMAIKLCPPPTMGCDSTKLTMTSTTAASPVAVNWKIFKAVPHLPITNVPGKK